MHQTHANGDTAADAESVRSLRLHELLRELVRDEGRMEAAELLGVNSKTVMRAVESGRLSRRVSDALERLQAGDSPPNADQRRDNREELEKLKQRLGRLERSAEALAEELRGGLEEVRMAVAEQVRGLRAEWGRAQAQERGRAGPEEAVRVIGSQPVTARAAAIRRFAPQVVVAEPEDGDEESYGEAWPLVEEWRRLRDGHPHQGKGVSWLVTEERLFALELAMLEEHGLTLPPEDGAAAGLRSLRPDQLAQDGPGGHPPGAGLGGGAALGAQGARVRPAAGGSGCRDAHRGLPRHGLDGLRGGRTFCLVQQLGCDARGRRRSPGPGAETGSAHVVRMYVLYFRAIGSTPKGRTPTHCRGRTHQEEPAR